MKRGSLLSAEIDQATTPEPVGDRLRPVAWCIGTRCSPRTVISSNHGSVPTQPDVARRDPLNGPSCALSFLTTLVLAARYHANRSRRHKTITDWTRPMLGCPCRWRMLITAGASPWNTRRA